MLFKNWSTLTILRFHTNGYHICQFGFNTYKTTVSKYRLFCLWGNFYWFNMDSECLTINKICKHKPVRTMAKRSRATISTPMIGLSADSASSRRWAISTHWKHETWGQLCLYISHFITFQSLNSNKR